MVDQVRLSRGKPRSPGRGTRKPRARNPGSKDPAAAAFQVFGELQQREFNRSPWPMRIFEHGTFRFLAVNDAAVKLYGYSREEFLRMTTTQTRHPDEISAFSTTLDKPTGYFRHREPRRHIRKNGEIIVVEIVTQDILFHGRKAHLSMNIDVTERKRAEEELRRQKHLLETFINNIPARIFIRDAKTLRYVMRNRVSEERSGHPIGGSIGKSAYDLFSRELADLFSRTDAEALKTGRLVEIPELRVTEKSGETRIMHVRKVPVFDDNGQAWVLVGISEDITERKRTEQVLRESNEFLRSVIESSRDCIKVLDLEGRLQMISAGGQRLMEIDDASSLLGESYVDFWSGGERDAASKALAAARAGETSRFEGCCPTFKGVSKWWDVIVSPILGKDGAPEKLLVVSRDVTEHKRADQELRETQQHLQVAVQGGGVGLWDWNVATGAVYFSPEWKRQLGYEDHEIPSHSQEWERRLHPQDKARVSAEVKGLLDRPEADYQAEYRLRHRDGSYRWILSRGSMQFGRDGKAERMFGCHVDITDQKRAEAERLEGAVRQRDALVREVHHRIKNSLQGVVGLLRQKIRKNPAMTADIEETISQLQSVALVYGLQETRPDGMIALAEIVEEVCASTEGITGGQVERTLERKSPRPACVAGTEAVSIAVALNELVFNALKHQPARAGKKRAQVMLRETDNGAEIRITNRGRLPQGFDYAAGRAVGHGLGLVRTLLASPGGDVQFSNGRSKVEVVLKLGPPLLAERQKWLTRRVDDGGTGKKKAAAARTGRGRRPVGAGGAG